MPLKGDQNREYMREYMRKRRAAAKGGPKPKQATAKPTDRTAALEAEVAALKADLARERKQRAAAPARSDDDEPAASGPAGRKAFKLLLKLDDANDNTVLIAARKLVGELKANGSDLRVLADALGVEWEKQEKRKPAKPKPIDWPAVAAAIEVYAADKTTVRYGPLWRAIIKAVPVLDEPGGAKGITEYISGCMRRLGFTGKGSTWTRKPVTP